MLLDLGRRDFQDVAIVGADSGVGEDDVEVVDAVFGF